MMLRSAIDRCLLAGAWLSARAAGVTCDTSVRFYGRPIVSIAPHGRIVVGPRSVLIGDSRHTALGVSHPVLLRLLRPHAAIHIGADTGLSGTSICAAIGVSIGDQCLLGADVVIADTDFHALSPLGRRYTTDQSAIAAAPISIGRNVFIGVRAVVLKGVTIGDDSVIGAGSIVTQDIPAGVIAAGNPCRVLRPL